MRKNSAPLLLRSSDEECQIAVSGLPLSSAVTQETEPIAGSVFDVEIFDSETLEHFYLDDGLVMLSISKL